MKASYYVFKVTVKNAVKFIPVSASNVLTAVDIMKANGFKDFVLL